MFEGAKALLSAAGLPPQFWPYAIRDYYCFAENIKMIDGDSAWNKPFKKGHFRGPVIPFGCLVDFKQTPEKADRMPKAAPDAVPGVMFRYTLNPGGIWNGEFYFVPCMSWRAWIFLCGALPEMCQFKLSRKFGEIRGLFFRC